MRQKPKKTSKIAQLIINHIQDNFKAYIIVSLILLIGIVLGIGIYYLIYKRRKEKYN